MASSPAPPEMIATATSTGRLSSGISNARKSRGKTMSSPGASGLGTRPPRTESSSVATLEPRMLFRLAVPPTLGPALVLARLEDYPSGP